VEDGTIPKAHRVFEVTMLKAAVSAWESRMQGIHALVIFMKKKEQAFLGLLKLRWRGGFTDVRQ
jgi:hypothetical protein